MLFEEQAEIELGGDAVLHAGFEKDERFLDLHFQFREIELSWLGQKVQGSLELWFA